jgi:hypothetical protein
MMPWCRAPPTDGFEPAQAGEDGSSLLGGSRSMGRRVPEEQCCAHILRRASHDYRSPPRRCRRDYPAAD